MTSVIRLLSISCIVTCSVQASELREARSTVFSNHESPKISTPFGTLIGNSDRNGCDEWLGVPYAKPPIGELRFANTVPWDQPYKNGSFKAVKPSHFCAQKSGGSEDCLYLNVWRPSDSDTPLLPVMIFIHGGSFTSGSSLNSAPGIMPDSMSAYNGCKLSAEQNIIVASMNYRLGPFGFAAFFNERSGTAANFGLQDQRTAIEWLRAHATSFGGNPDAITIFGESAGAMSVLIHVASPRSKGLFRAAISQSGYPIALSWKQGLENTRRLSQRLGCDEKNEKFSVRSCLQGKSTKQLIRAAVNLDSISPQKFLTRTGWKPVVDGLELPEHPLKAMASITTGPSVPLFVGTNTDEANLFLDMNYRFFGMRWPGQFADWLESFTSVLNMGTKFNSTQINRVNDLYSDIKKNNKLKASAIATDGSFLCGTQAVAQTYHRAKVFVYRFNHRPRCPSAQMVAGGVYHSLDLMYVFNSPEFLFCKFDEVDKSIGLRMRTMWANFAKTLNPSLQKYQIDNMSVISILPYTNFDQNDYIIQGYDGDLVEQSYRSAKCKFWIENVYDSLFTKVMRPSDGNELAHLSGLAVLT